MLRLASFKLEIGSKEFGSKTFKSVKKCFKSAKDTLPEAQRTQAIESVTPVISFFVNLAQLPGWQTAAK